MELILTTAQPKNKMQRRLLLNIVVRKGTSVLELLSCENQALLIGRNALLVLNFLLHVINRIRRFDIEGNGLSSQGFDEDLHVDCLIDLELVVYKEI